MKTTAKIICFCTGLLAGCAAPQWPTEVVIQPSPAPAAAQQDTSDTRRFQQTPQGQTVVESAMELSEKYAAVSEENSLVRSENRKLADENRQLKDSLNTCSTQLQQTQEELTRANDLLVEMRVELNNWKTDILGFRSEMREAEKTQLEALLKILNILGGEKTEPNVPETPAGEPNNAGQGKT